MSFLAKVPANKRRNLKNPNYSKNPSSDYIRSLQFLIRMRKSILVSTAVFLYFSSFSQKKLIGFNEANSAKQVEWEKTFDAQMNAQDLDTWMKFLASHPHHVGSPQDKANADYMANLFRQWGYQTEIASYNVLFPTPKTRMLELLGDKPYKAKLEESAIPGDPYTTQKAEQLPAYNAYSADGDITAQLVFVNRGVPDDYDELARRGIDVKGKIVLAKYGGSWRGIKPKVAYEGDAKKVLQDLIVEIKNL